MAAQGGGSGSNTPQQRGAGPESLFERILSGIFGTNDPERLRKRRLKQLGKSIKKSRFNFYKPRGKQALPGLARFLFDVYKALGPAQSLLQGASESNVLRNICVERMMTEDQKELLPLLSEDHLRQEASKSDMKQMTGAVKKRLVRFVGEFDAARVKAVNTSYNQTQIFLALVKYDFYFALRKFDSSFAENNFNQNPKFESINVDYLLDDLKDFLEVFLPVDKNLDFDTIFAVLNEYRGMEVVSRPSWNKVMSTIDSVQKSKILTEIVQHAEDDPRFQPVVSVPNERIVEAYVEKLKRTTEAIIQKMRSEIRSNKIEKLVSAVFGTTAIARTKYYTEQANATFAKRMVAGYTLTAPINYLKAFLIDFFKRDVREIQELLIIRGKWSSNILSHQISEAFHKTMEISEELVNFDNSLAEEGERGQKIKKAMGRVVDRDPSTTKLLRQQLEEVNDEAQRMVNESAQNLITIGKSLKTVLEDYDREHHEMVLNWKEIESSSERPIRERLLEAYKKIYYFIQLMQMYVKERKPASAS